jgi:uncharacterized protein (DUF362 family)
MNLNASLTAIRHRAGTAYPAEQPYHPAEAYPEYPFDAKFTGESNDVYAMVRDVFRDLGMDSEHYGTPEWNPLGDIIKPGQKVVIKPNLVQDRHYLGGDVLCLVTHGSVVRAVMDYVFKALNGEGSITLGDAPVLSTLFEGALQAARMNKVVDFYQQHAEPKLAMFDFRTVAGELDDHFHVTQWIETPGDPSGNVAFELNRDSMLAPIGHLSHLFRLPHYRKGDTNPYHEGQNHTYVVPHCIIDADVIINIPKMKTHCKAGITAALKNFVGIVALRHCYTNYRYGDPAHDGDEYPKHSIVKVLSENLERMIDGNQTPGIRQLLALAYRANERLRRMLGIDGIYEGRWYGNDTVWRAILDLNRIAHYGQLDGTMADKRQRKIFTFVDGIIAGEDEGPLEAEAKQADCLYASLNPVAIDVATAALMHFDYRKISTVREAVKLRKWPLLETKPEELPFSVNGENLDLAGLETSNVCTPFVPARGWIGHIEQDKTEASTSA